MPFPCAPELHVKITKAQGASLKVEQIKFQDYGTHHIKIRISLQQEKFKTSSNLYQVVINGEDGEYVEYEIEADSHSEASAKAEALAADSFIDISYIEVYLIH